MPGGPGEPFLAHFGVHVRLLVAVPALIVAEGALRRFTLRIVPHLVRTGTVAPEDLPRYAELILRLARRRDAWLPWAIIAGVVTGWTLLVHLPAQAHEASWEAGAAGAPWVAGFGAWWLLYVARPVYLLLVCGWAWRWVLLWMWLRGVARLPPRIVPSHPDRAGGLGPLGGISIPMGLVVFATSSMVASVWAHDAFYHGLDVRSLWPHMVVFLAGAILVCLAPLLALAPRLKAARRRAVLDYGTLAAEHGRLLHRRWIEGERLEAAPVLGAPELGPAADVATLYVGIVRMRLAPIDIRSLAPVALAVGLPFLTVVAIQIPIKDLLLRVVGALA